MIADTPFKAGLRERKSRRTENLIAKGWTYDFPWWHSPHTGLRYPFHVACDVEDLREAWKDPLVLDWTIRRRWANQYSEGGDDYYTGPEIW